MSAYNDGHAVNLVRATKWLTCSDKNAPSREISPLCAASRNREARLPVSPRCRAICQLRDVLARDAIKLLILSHEMTLQGAQRVRCQGYSRDCS